MLLKEEINKYLNYCKFQKELDDKTIKAYKADLEQFITVIGENNPDKEMLNAYLVYLHRMYKQKTVKRKIASVKALFHYLEEEELIEINPFHKVKTKFREEVILPKIIPRDIIEQLLNHLYKERSIKEYSEWRKKIILRDIAVVETLFSTGLRISELCHLQNKYVDLKNGVLCIQGKGGKERYLQIGNNDVLSILNAYKKSFEDEIKKQGYFFVNRYGNALSEQSARSMIHKYAGEIQADINITPHMFRHSFAHYLINMPDNIELNSYYVMKRFVVDEIVKYDNPYPFVHGLALRVTRNIANVEIRHDDRMAGTSGYNLHGLIRLWLNGFTAFSEKPLRLASVSGVVCASAGIIYALIIIIRKLLGNITASGYSSMMAALLFFCGVIMLFLGLLGEYIGRMYICINNAPQYAIRETKNIEIGLEQEQISKRE